MELKYCSPRLLNGLSYSNICNHLIQFIQLLIFFGYADGQSTASSLDFGGWPQATQQIWSFNHLSKVKKSLSNFQFKYSLSFLDKQMDWAKHLAGFWRTVTGHAVKTLPVSTFFRVHSATLDQKNLVHIHCWHYIIATSLIYYINGHCFKFATGH